jgi:mannose-6-phosphate isomerase-like protein (cupin superfamily)
MLPPLLRTTDSAESINMIGQDVRVLLAAADTGGTHSLFYQIVPPGDGPPRHMHTREDETFIVLDGVLEFLVGTPPQTLRAGPGSCVYGPRGVPHTFRNPGPGNARILVLFNPGGFERFGRELEKLFPPGAPLDIPALTRLMEAHGMRVLTEP